MWQNVEGARGTKFGLKRNGNSCICKFMNKNKKLPEELFVKFVEIMWKCETLDLIAKVIEQKWKLKISYLSEKFTKTVKKQNFKFMYKSFRKNVKVQKFQVIYYIYENVEKRRCWGNYLHLIMKICKEEEVMV